MSSHRLDGGPTITPQRLINRLLHGSLIFPTKKLAFQSGPEENVVLGGRDTFPLVAKAFDHAGIKQILFIGWGSQGPAQAQNLRDTLKHIGREDIKVCVGLRSRSKSIPAAKLAGFTSENGTLGEPLALASQSDLIICLVADAAMVKIHKDVFAAAKPGAIIGISHGFIVGYWETIGTSIPEGRDLIMVAPKGMGPSVRKLYVQGLTTEGAGINSSVAIHVADSNRFDLVREVANAWSVGIGSPVTFGTTFLDEVTSDLFGERAILLGGLWGITEALLEYYMKSQSLYGHKAFEYAVSGLTGTVTEQLSKLGIWGFYESLSTSEQFEFNRGYAIGYPVCGKVHKMIYKNVASQGRPEIKDVIHATALLDETLMESVESNPIWKQASEGGWNGKSIVMCDELAFSAGVYVGALMSQLHLLLQHGHCVSETVNESYIEAVDSLTPYMHSRGVAFMVDNCSTTARLGTRRWGPEYKDALYGVLMSPDSWPSPAEQANTLLTLNDPLLHQDIDLCLGLRPSVRISIPLAVQVED